MLRIAIYSVAEYLGRGEFQEALELEKQAYAVFCRHLYKQEALKRKLLEDFARLYFPGVLAGEYDILVMHCGEELTGGAVLHFPGEIAMLTKARDHTTGLRSLECLLKRCMSALGVDCPRAKIDRILEARFTTLAEKYGWKLSRATKYTLVYNDQKQTEQMSRAC